MLAAFSVHAFCVLNVAFKTYSNSVFSTILQVLCRRWHWTCPFQWRIAMVFVILSFVVGCVGRVILAAAAASATQAHCPDLPPATPRLTTKGCKIVFQKSHWFSNVLIVWLFVVWAFAELLLFSINLLHVLRSVDFVCVASFILATCGFPMCWHRFRHLLFAC